MSNHFLSWMGAHPRTVAALAICGAGISILLFSVAGIYPAQTLARFFSDDGTLTEAYVGLIQTGQVKLGIAFLLAAGLAGWVDARRLARFTRELPFWQVAAVAGLLALLLSFAVQEYLFDGIPHVTDATSHLFQAKIFAAGRLFAPAPPCPDAFWQPNVMMTTSGKWFSKYTPGHALLLAGGMRLGVLRWVLPFCVAATIVLLGRILADYEGKVSAGLFMCFFALSPLSLLLGGSYMSHSSAMALAVAGLFFWLKSRQTERTWGRPPLHVAAGFLFAFSALVRPHEFLLIGLIGFLFFLTLKAGEWRWLLKGLPFLMLGAGPVIVFWLFWNHSLYGNPFAIGYGYSTKGVIRTSFQGQLGFSSSCGIKEALSVLIWNVDRFNRSSLGFPFSLIFVPFAFLQRGGRIWRLAILGVAVVMGAYFFYVYRSEFEARYYYLALPFFLYLTVRGIRNVVGLRFSASWRNGASQLVFVLLGAFYLHATISYWPDDLLPRYGHEYEQSSTRVEQAVREKGLTHAVVMIGPTGESSFFYSSGFVFNDPFLRRDVIYARKTEAAADCLRNAFPGRLFYGYIPTTEGRGMLVPSDPGREDAAELFSAHPQQAAEKTGK